MSVASTPEQQPTRKRKGGVAAGLATAGFGRPEEPESPEGGGPASPAPSTGTATTGKPGDELTAEQREEQERLGREAQERRDREERERLAREEEERKKLVPPPAPATTEPEKRGRGRAKSGREVRTGRSFRATDEEYQMVYDTLDALFTRASAAERRKIEASAVIRAALRIAKDEPDRILQEIRDHNDFL